MYCKKRKGTLTPTAIVKFLLDLQLEQSKCCCCFVMGEKGGMLDAGEGSFKLPAWGGVAMRAAKSD